MRLYSAGDEQRLRLQASVRDWTRAGLLDRAQGAKLEADLRVDLRRTGMMLRLGLALFTAIVVGAAVGLVFVVLELRNEGPIGITAALMALGCIAAADGLVRRFRLYRHGLEEMLAVAGVMLSGTSAAMLVAAVAGQSQEKAALVAGLTAGAMVAFALYRRFGFQYLAMAAMGCAALIPFPLAFPHPLKRLIAAAVLASAFAAARALRRRHGYEFPGDEGADLQAAAFIGVYLALNLHATSYVLFSGPPDRESWFWWGSYAATWLIPVLGLWYGIREREQRMIDVSLLAALVTLLTNKLYLGWPRETWDPMLLGAFLIAVALAVRRWLSLGKRGERHGFTPARLLESDADAIQLLGLVSVTVQPTHDMPAATAEPSAFRGGRSGGAGGGADF